MLKTILKTISGLILLIAGLGIGYFYLININNGSNALLLIPSFSIIILAIFLLISAGKSDETVIQKPEISTENQSGETKPRKMSLIEQNNAITQAWLKSSEKKDKMKLLKMIANAEENPYEGK